jgi:hypothetical protein
MHTSSVLVCLAFGVAASLATPSKCRAAILDLPPPTGAGTPEVDAAGNRQGFAPGWEASGALGSGFSDTYGLGVEGRVGFTFPVGVYLGGQVQAFYGEKVAGQTAHATFFGPELGYKLYLIDALEIRPYVFGGLAFITEANTSVPILTSRTGFAIQPGGMATYHVGPAFVGADCHLMTTPTPFGVAVFGTAGASL